MAGRSLIPLLVAMMLVTGVANTIITKYQVCPSPPLAPDLALSSFYAALLLGSLFTDG